MKETWICSECGKRIDDPYQRDNRRIEYRADVKDARDWTVTVGRICKPCAKAEVEDLRSGRKEIVIVLREHSTQETLI